MHTEFWWWLLGNRPLGRRRKRWKINIKMCLRETGFADGIYMQPAGERTGSADTKVQHFCTFESPVFHSSL
jgi:hypothetical protein